jgi:hypothetical protein
MARSYHRNGVFVHQCSQCGTEYGTWDMAHYCCTGAVIGYGCEGYGWHCIMADGTRIEFCTLAQCKAYFNANAVTED